MKNAIVLRLNDKNIYNELTKALYPHREQGPKLFIVEGTEKSPIIEIRYPGKKVKRRQLRVARANSALWANLYDFEIVPLHNGKGLTTAQFTFQSLMKDFEENKKNSEKFWSMLEELYRKNTITKNPPKLIGLDPLFFLMILKWIWIQEDLNYKYSWHEVQSPIPYVLQTRTGTITRKGAGRGKFFAALILLKYFFTFDEVKKIIPLY